MASGINIYSFFQMLIPFAIHSSVKLTSPFISETVRDRSMVAMEHQQEVIGGGSIRVGFNDLE